MRQDEYKKLLESDGEIILNSADITEWLDGMVDALNQYRQNYYSLYYGELIDGEFENEIEVCGDPFSQIQIYKGIDKLVNALGYELVRLDRACTEYPYEFYFMYKGIKIFQLGSDMEIVVK